MPHTIAISLIYFAKQNDMKLDSVFFTNFRFKRRYRVVMMGDAGVGKTALVSQFMTSEYMNTYDASLGKFQGKYFSFLYIYIYKC